uniref:Uncharacterized protein n=1 Tax=Anguilla anguilla TaxID=7936 RepID=A0A0E9R618_ANGAN
MDQVLPQSVLSLLLREGLPRTQPGLPLGGRCLPR